MKKNKLIGIILSAMMIILCFSTIAAESRDTYNITINNPNSGHTYEAYQIFSGRLEEVNGENLLSDIQWGTGVNGEQLLNALKNEHKFSSCDNAAQIADILSKKESNSQEMKEFAKIAGKHLITGSAKESEYKEIENKYVISGLESGYYLVKDKDSSVSGNDAYTDFILGITDNNKEVHPKSSVPTVEKKVLENSDQQWKDVADYSIGDEISFRLIGSLPNNISSYKTYTYSFHDTMDKGFELIEGSVKAYIDSGKDTEREEIDLNNFHLIQSPSDNYSFEVKFNDLKTIFKENGDQLDKNDKIIVEYKAKLNDHAVIAGDGNTNKVSLEFSNNPNGTETGRTPEDTVKVFTYELVVNKKDENKNPLIGAEFKLYKSKGDNQWDDGHSWTSLNENIFKFTGLDSGTYKLVETKSPAGYNKIEDIVFEINSTYNNDTLQNLVIKDKNGSMISGEGKSFNVNLVPNDSTPNIATDVINKKGAILPDTGGIGTTIFYIAGSMIMIGAAVVFVAKKRKKTN